jgi:hypothetical protein
MDRRRRSLVNMGHAIRLEDGRIRVSKDLIADLEWTEATRVGNAMAAERGLTFTTTRTANMSAAHLSARPSSQAAASP